MPSTSQNVPPMRPQRTIWQVRYDAIVFDLGNTLLPWGEEQNRALYAALERTLADAFGPLPDFEERATRARQTLYAERKRTTMREVTVDELLHHFLDGPAPAELPAAVVSAVERVFLDVARFPPGTRELLERLARRHPIAVLSNFFLTPPVEAVLERGGLRDLFVHVEVSATSGYMKPHPTPFAAVRDALGVDGPVLMVGDDFWADVVGGHRAGFLTALTHEHRQDVTSDPGAPDVRAGRILKSLHELDGQP